MKRRIPISTPLAALVVGVCGIASAADSAGSLSAARSQETIQLDGRLDDASWKAATVVADLAQQSPRSGDLSHS